jgi:hypothetical protein
MANKSKYEYLCSVADRKLNSKGLQPSEVCWKGFPTVKFDEKGNRTPQCQQNWDEKFNGGFVIRQHLPNGGWTVISKNSENIPRGMDVFKAGKESEMDIHTARLSTAIRILHRKPTEPWTAVSVSADGTIYPKKASDKIDGLTYLTTERPVLHKYWIESGSPATIDDIKHCDMVPEVESEVVSL